jgi:hypothetical protein
MRSKFKLLPKFTEQKKSGERKEYNEEKNIQKLRQSEPFREINGICCDR